MRNRYLLPSLFLMLVFASVSAREMGDLSGMYHFSGGISEGRELIGNSHLIIDLSGDVARDLYENLRVEARRDECLDDGSMTKYVGNISCTKLTASKKYVCNFAIDINKQKLDIGNSC